MNKTKLNTLAAVGALVTLLLLTGCGSTSNSEDSEPVESSETEIAEEAVPGVGDTVTDEKINFIVNSVTCTVDPMEDDTYAPLSPNGQFCKVNVSATATSDIGMFLGQITISTEQGNGELNPAVGAMMYKGTLTPDYIDNGQTLTGDVIFDIPVDDVVTSVLLRHNPLSDGVTVTID